MATKNNPFLKWYYRIMMLLFLGGAIAFPFFMKNNQGQPMLSLPGSDGISSKPFVETTTTVYKWKDANGTWQFGDTPPDNAAVEVLQVSNHANLMPATPIPKPEVSTSTPVLSNTQTNRNNPQTTEDVLTIENAMNIIEDAHAVRGMMESRNDELRKISGDR